MPELPIAFNSPHVFVLVAFVLLLTLVRSLGRSSKRIRFKTYSLKRSVLTPTEMKFYKTLVACVPANHTLLIKPRMADYVKVAPFDQSALIGSALSMSTSFCAMLARLHLSWVSNLMIHHMAAKKHEREMLSWKLSISTYRYLSIV